MVDRVFDDRGIDCETVYRSDRDDWVLAMIASGSESFRRNCVQCGCSQSGAMSAAAGFLSFQGMVSPSVGWKEQRPTVGV
jgi:hypothetical protein